MCARIAVREGIVELCVSILLQCRALNRQIWDAIEQPFLRRMTFFIPSGIIALECLYMIFSKLS